MIANSGKDENGRYSGGKAGDQTTHEWEVRTWYNRPWNCVLRHPDKSVGKDIALIALHGAANDLIGYDQYQRTTLWAQLEKAKNYDPANIKTACEADCSAGVAAVVKAVGYRKGIEKLKAVSKDCWTGNLRAALKAAGFEVLTDRKYLSSDAYLLPGDILLNESSHTAINLDAGSKATAKPEASSAKPVTDALVNEVKLGNWGNEPVRTAKLKAAGYDPVAVQAAVNASYGNKPSAPAAAKAVKYTVTSRIGVNVRKDASIGAAIVKAYPKGKTVSVTSVKEAGGIIWGKTADGWFAIKKNGIAYAVKN